MDPYPEIDGDQQKVIWSRREKNGWAASMAWQQV